MRKEDLTGLRFGKLTVLWEAEGTKTKTRWLCKCDCGNTSIVQSSNLKSGNTSSCGCLIGRNGTHHMRNTRQYRIWCGILTRCNNVNDSCYKKYGQKGITVCEEWKSFDKFWEDMKHGYSDELTIDRIDNTKGYYKENCRWATITEQARNKSNNVKLTYNGITKCLNEWAMDTGIKRTTLRARIFDYKWSVKEAIETPVLSRGAIRLHFC